jgi:hypothetical protein
MHATDVVRQGKTSYVKKSKRTSTVSDQSSGSLVEEETECRGEEARM